MFINGWQIYIDQGSSGKPLGVLDGSGTHPTSCAKEAPPADFCLSLEWQQAKQRITSLWVGNPLKTKSFRWLGTEESAPFLPCSLGKYTLAYPDGTMHLEQPYKRQISLPPAGPFLAQISHIYSSGGLTNVEASSKVASNSPSLDRVAAWHWNCY
jgi:hypothetical protein